MANRAIGRECLYVCVLHHVCQNLCHVSADCNMAVQLKCFFFDVNDSHIGANDSVAITLNDVSCMCDN